MNLDETWAIKKRNYMSMDSVLIVRSIKINSYFEAKIILKSLGVIE